jgi:hypothetical protein
MPHRPACTSSLLALLGLISVAVLQAGACSSNPEAGMAAPDAGGDAEAGTPPAFLTPADVTGLPRGNAAGKIFVATLQSQTSAIETCTCRAGSCTAFPDLPFLLILEADNGALEMMHLRGGTFPACSGGADTDGRFWCGGVDSQGGLHLTSGQITWTADGTITSVRLTKKESGRGHDGYGQPLDCDVTESATFKPI